MKIERGAMERKKDNLLPVILWSKGTSKAKIKTDKIHIIIFSRLLKK